MQKKEEKRKKEEKKKQINIQIKQEKSGKIEINPKIIDLIKIIKKINF